MDSIEKEGREFNIDQLSEISKLTDGEISVEQLTQMVDISLKGKENSYSPYSKFRVGCCLLTKEGKYYQGTNVENVSYGLSICAERSAIVSSVSQGEKTFTAVLVSSDMDYFISPCGACRQFLVEFGIKYCILLTKDMKLQYFTMNFLLPSGVTIPHLKK